MYARQLNHARFATRLSRRSRGSAVVLVVVSLVLMALLGAVYLQTTRVQSFTAREQESNIQSVIAAIIAQIQETLLEDLTDDPGNGNHLELYDYPWTNRNSAPFLAERFDGSTVPAIGGLFDDPWLGSSTPDFNDPANPVWRKITNLNGLFLAYDNDTGNFVIDGITHRPVEHEVDFRNWPSIEDSYSDTNLLLNSPTFKQLVDASGDGIPDSRWAWAPLRQIRDVQYVMAVRIVDLSGKININTALSLGASSSGTYGYDTTYADPAHPSFSAPFFHTPSELDLGGFVFGLSGNTPLHMAELNNALTHRFGTAVNTQVPLVMRDNFWLNQGRQLVSNTGAGYRMYGRDNTYELLRREGLNQDPTGDGRTLAVEDAGSGMPDFLRRDAIEAIYTDVNLTRYGGAASATRQQWYELEPRKQMTGESGAAIFAWPRPGEGMFDGSWIKGDINHLLASNPVGLTEEIARVFNDMNPADVPGALSPGIDSVDRFANQFVASMADYADADNQLTELEDPANAGEFHYGFEALPFVTEVYSQALYQIIDVTVTQEELSPGPPPVNATVYTATWERQENAGYAIEIRNPFRKPISLDQVELVMVVDGAEASWGMLWDNDAGVGLAGQATLAPDEVLILYRDSNEGLNFDPANDTVGDATTPPATDMVHDDPIDSGTHDLFTGLPMNYTVRALAQNWPEIPVAAGAGAEFISETFEIHLRARIADRDDADPNRMITYSKAKGQRAPREYIETVDDGGDATANPNAATKFTVGNKSYWQHAWAGNGEGLNILAVYHENFASHETPPLSESGQVDPLRPREGKATFAGTLGKVTKSGATGPFNSTQLRAQQIILSDRGEFFHIGEIAHVMAMGPIRDLNNSARDRTVREVLAEAWSSGGAWRADASVEDFMLNFDPSTTGNLISTNPTYDNFRVPYAALLIDRLTTLSPRTDGVDNDGDGTINNSNENIIPGLINLNTAPRKLLEKVIPVADPWLRWEIARRIVAYRDAQTAADRAALDFAPPAALAAHYRDNPGIAHTGELFFILDDLLRTDWSTRTDQPFDPGPNYSGDVEQAGGTRVDFLSNPAANAADGIANDREEMALLAGWLSQVGTVRSDYFAAYVLVRGYRAGGFNASDGLVEGARFIAIFRRNAADGEIHVQMIAPLHGRPYMVN